jgi:hemin uptake protein HemP
VEQSGREPPSRDEAGDGARGETREPATIDAGTLFGARREVVILHKGERYRLRVTQNDKLILTK